MNINMTHSGYHPRRGVTVLPWSVTIITTDICEQPDKSRAKQATSNTWPPTIPIPHQPWRNCGTHLNSGQSPAHRVEHHTESDWQLSRVPLNYCNARTNTTLSNKHNESKQYEYNLLHVLGDLNHIRLNWQGELTQLNGPRKAQILWLYYHHNPPKTIKWTCLSRPISKRSICFFPLSLAWNGKMWEYCKFYVFMT